MFFLKIAAFTSILTLGLGSLSVEVQALKPILLVQRDAESEFPLPEAVQNLTKQPGAAGTQSINFQTNLSLQEALEFYRKTLTEQGLKEREINTAITDTTFSIVFEGAENGLAVVVQSIDLGELRNINIRYEKLD